MVKKNFVNNNKFEMLVADTFIKKLAVGLFWSAVVLMFLIPVLLYLYHHSLLTTLVLVFVPLFTALGLEDFFSEDC